MKELERLKSEGLIKFENLKDSAHQLSVECSQINVIDNITEALALQIVSKAKGFSKQVEEKREELKRPYIDIGKAIDATAKSVVEDLNKSIKMAIDNILKYKQLEEAKRLAELKRIQNLKDKLNEVRDEIVFAIDNSKNVEELKGVYIKYIKTFPGQEVWQDINPSAQELLEYLKVYGANKKKILLNPEAIAETTKTQIQLEKEIVSTTKYAGEENIAINISEKKTGMRSTWDYEVVDITKVPLSMLTIDESKVKEFIKKIKEEGLLKEECVMHGLRLFQKQSLVIR